MIEQLWLIPLGFAAGVLGSMIGLGGGVIMVPVLTFAGFPPTLAASNSLLASLSSSVSATVAYSRIKRVDFSLGTRLGLLSVPGTILGAVVSTDVNMAAFKILFGLVLVAATAYIFLGKRPAGGDAKTSVQMAVFAAGASFFAGMISSFFGIGGGIVFVPMMVAAMGLSAKRAAPTSQLILIFTSSSGVISHTLLGHPDFLQAGLLASGSFFGGLAGVRLSLQVKERFLQVMASSVILAVAAKMFYDSVVSLSAVPDP